MTWIGKSEESEKKERGNGERGNGERGNGERGNGERGNEERGNEERGNEERGNEERGNEERGNELRRCGAQTPNVRLRGQGLGAVLCLLALMPAAYAQVPTIDREAVYQKALAAYQDDAALPLSVKRSGAQKIGTTTFERFSYLSTNKQRVPALLFTPASASAARPVPCIVILHGLGGSKEIMSGMALYAAKAGYASLVIDEYGQGERGPLKTPPGGQAEELATGVSQTAVDVRRGLDYLATRPTIDSKRIGLAGVSLGAIIGTVTAGVEPRIKAAVLISGGGDWGLILRTLSARNANVGGRDTSAFKKIDFARLNLLLAPEDPLTFAPHIAPRPILMLAGRKDTTIVPQAQAELFDAARQPKQIVWYPQYGHVPPPEVVYPAMTKFFGSKL